MAFKALGFAEVRAWFDGQRAPAEQLAADLAVPTARQPMAARQALRISALAGSAPEAARAS
eukprot:15457347-Alexandrium_andersonii.AAC.1